MQRFPRILFLAPGAVALVTGLLAGAARMGIALPEPIMGMSDAHGPLMAVGFLSTVIGLERAVALGKDWAYFAPLFTGLGGLLFLLGLPFAAYLMLMGTLVLAFAGMEGWRRQPSLHSSVMALGAGANALAAALWTSGLDVPEIVALWMAFLILTIAGERLELTRFLPPSKIRSASLVVLSALILASSVACIFDQDAPARLLGAALLGLAVWLFVFDVARRNLKETGLTRFIGAALISGYVWLAVGGIALLHHAIPSGGFEYDAVLHLVFIGFVFSMIFGHAPVILPAVLKRQAPYHPLMTVWLALLHAGLALRIAGDHTADALLRQAGGLMNEAAIVLFIATVAARAVQAAKA